MALTSCLTHQNPTKIYPKHSVKLATRMVNDSSGREVIFVPLRHLGQPQHYDQIKEFVTQKRNEGYAIYYEKIEMYNPDEKLRISQKYTTTKFFDLLHKTNPLDTTATVDQDIYNVYIKALKLRQILGQNIFTPQKHADTTNKSLTHTIKPTDVAQTDHRIGIIDTLDTWADIHLETLLVHYENATKPITLTQYDLTTPLLGKYTTPDTCKHNKKLFTLTLRDQHTTQKILNSTDPKILLLFGANHLPGICNLGLKNAGFTTDTKFTTQKFRKQYKKSQKNDRN